MQELGTFKRLLGSAASEEHLRNLVIGERDSSDLMIIFVDDVSGAVGFKLMHDVLMVLKDLTQLSHARYMRRGGKT